jgi:hypothetical protein
MGSQTLMMEWHQLKDTLSECNVALQEDAWLALLEHEKHMESKGYEFKFNRVISPEGEVIWESSDA